MEPDIIAMIISRFCMYKTLEEALDIHDKIMELLNKEGFEIVRK